MQLYIRRCFIICMCKILVQNFIIKDILKKEKRCSLNFCTDYSNVGTFWQYQAVMMKGFGIRANDLPVIRIVLMQL